MGEGREREAKLYGTLTWRLIYDLVIYVIYDIVDILIDIPHGGPTPASGSRLPPEEMLRYVYTLFDGLFSSRDFS